MRRHSIDGFTDGYLYKVADIRQDAENRVLSAINPALPYLTEQPGWSKTVFSRLPDVTAAGTGFGQAHLAGLQALKGQDVSPATAHVGDLARRYVAGAYGRAAEPQGAFDQTKNLVREAIPTRTGRLPADLLMYGADTAAVSDKQLRQHADAIGNARKDIGWVTEPVRTPDDPSKNILERQTDKLRRYGEVARRAGEYSGESVVAPAVSLLANTGAYAADKALAPYHPLANELLALEQAAIRAGQPLNERRSGSPLSRIEQQLDQFQRVINNTPKEVSPVLFTNETAGSTQKANQAYDTINQHAAQPTIDSLRRRVQDVKAQAGHYENWLDDVMNASDQVSGRFEERLQNNTKTNPLLRVLQAGDAANRALYDLKAEGLKAYQNSGERD